MTREIIYRKEFRDIVYNWNQNRLSASILILGTMMVTMGSCLKKITSSGGKVYCFAAAQTVVGVN
jgi:hypothetical protein